MLDQETIDQQLELLATHRSTLAHLVQQAAQYSGEAFAPPQTANGISQARAEIQRIKAVLSVGGTVVEDAPNDDVQPTMGAAPLHLSPQEQRTRSRMLDKVEAFWVKGVLEQSFYQIVRLELGFEHIPAQVSDPWETVIHQTNQPKQTIPAGKSVIAVFDDFLGELLILGDPGAGKTTVLLELTRDLIARARQNEQYFIPVVFNLSTWATRRRPLKEWLVEELNARYDVPRKVAQAWIDADVVLPLLDGLDEVAAEYRGDCAEAINVYRQEHGLMPIAVCSRVTDYEALTTKLRLQGAVVVQPLTPPQVEIYLERAGEKMAGVRATLHDDAALGELLKTPLMLSMVALAYAGKSKSDMQTAGTSDERRLHLFDAYIEAMFTRRSKETRYTQKQTTQWLSWLAGKMVEHNQTVFYIERMQPAWLSTQRQRLYYYIIAACFLGTIGALNGGLVGGRVGGWTGVWSGALIGGLFYAIRFSDGEITTVEVVQWSQLWFQRAQLWSQRSRVTDREMLLRTVFLGVVIVFTAQKYGLGIGVGIVIVLIFILLELGLMIWNFLSKARFSSLIDTKRPNEGIWRSARHALLSGAIPLLGCAVLCGTFGWVIGWLKKFSQQSDPSIFPIAYLGGGLLIGLIAGTTTVLRNGGGAYIQHFILRFILWCRGVLPWNYTRYLDYCAERIFLRKVGGGYIFVHRLLMEHFASLHSEQLEGVTQQASDS